MTLPQPLSPFLMDHIGIAVSSLEEGAKFYKSLGFTQMHIEDVPTEKVRVGMFELKNNSRIELLEPMGPDSPIQKFLDRRGPGIHHICLRVPDIESVLADLKRAGVQLIDQTPKAGAHNCRIAFVHPKATGGVLIELSQKVGE